MQIEILLDTELTVSSCQNRGKVLLPLLKIRYSIIIGAAIYLAVLSLIFLEISYLFGLSIIGLSFLGLANQSAGRTILLPFYLFPFMFLIRAQSPDNIILSVLPDLSVIIAIVVHFTTSKIRRSNLGLFGLICLLSSIIFTINVYHVGELSYSALIVRQYVFPLVFLFVVVNSTLKNPGLHEEALFISLVSFSLVATLTLLNISGIIFIPRSMEALFPFLNFIEDTDNIEQISRSIGGISFPRLNLFTGGALGSSAAIFFILGLVALFNLQRKSFWVAKILSIPLLVAAAASLSTSLIIALMGYSIAFYFTVKGNFGGKLVGSIGIIGIGFLLTSISIMGLSPIDYFMETSAGGIVKHSFTLDFWEVMFGVGPRLTSAGFEFIPDKFIIDAGIFRVFVESGIIACILFLMLLIKIFNRGFRASYYRNVSAVRPYLAIFVVFILLVHANMTALPPFYPLFCIACLGMSQMLDRESS